MNQLEISFGTPLRIIVANEDQPATIEPWLTIWFDGFAVTAKGTRIMYTLPVDHFVKMKVSYKDAAGNPATVDGPVTWSSSDSTIATVVADTADDKQCKVTPLKLGQVQVVARADADLGQGVRDLITTSDIEVVAGEAVAGTIEPVGVPEPKP